MTEEQLFNIRYALRCRHVLVDAADMPTIVEAVAAAISTQARASEAEDAALQPETATVPVGELVALRRNAARYLWAKEHLFDYLPPKYNGNPKGRHDVLWYTEEHDLDKAIDAARATQGDAGSRGETK